MITVGTETALGIFLIVSTAICLSFVIVMMCIYHQLHLKREIVLLLVINDEAKL
jgi:hypothetical protein